MKKVLVCMLTSKAHLSPQFLLFNSFEEAEDYVESYIDKNKTFRYVCTSSASHISNKSMYSHEYYDQNKDFCKFDLIDIDIEDDDYIFMTYHVYSGIEFALVCNGTLELCIRGMNLFIERILHLKENDIIIDRKTDTSVTMDVGNEWIEGRIIKVSDLVEEYAKNHVLHVGDTVKVISKTSTITESDVELIPIDTVCKIVEVCYYDKPNLFNLDNPNNAYYGLVPLSNPDDVAYYYTNSTIEKGHMEWVKDL